MSFLILFVPETPERYTHYYVKLFGFGCVKTLNLLKKIGVTNIKNDAELDPSKNSDARVSSKT